MNDEISRILQMLEAGKINAAEAERLIRAVKDAAARATPPDDFWKPRPNPIHDLQELFRLFQQVQRQMRRRRIRRYWWHHFRLARWYEEQRRKRAETMTTYERVRFVLLGALLEEDFLLQPTTPLREILRRDQISWDYLRYGLEAEFRLEIPRSDLLALETVQALVDYLDTRLAPPPPPPSDAAEPAPPPPPDAPKPRRGKTKTETGA